MLLSSLEEREQVCLGQIQAKIISLFLYHFQGECSETLLTANIACQNTHSTIHNCALSVMSRWGVLFIVSGVADLLLNTGKM